MDAHALPVAGIFWGAKKRKTVIGNSDDFYRCRINQKLCCLWSLDMKKDLDRNKRYEAAKQEAQEWVDSHRAIGFHDAHADIESYQDETHPDYNVSTATFYTISTSLGKTRPDINGNNPHAIAAAQVKYFQDNGFTPAKAMQALGRPMPDASWVFVKHALSYIWRDIEWGIYDIKNAA